MTKKIMRGVQDIRTISGRVDERSIAYKAYMKLSILEMEKYRRGKEKTSALERVLHIDQRFKDIEAERQEIIATLETNGVRRQSLPGSKEPPKMATSQLTTSPFKIQY